jgi:hypothetical protein
VWTHHLRLCQGRLYGCCARSGEAARLVVTNYVIAHRTRVLVANTHVRRPERNDSCFQIRKSHS